MVYTTEIVKDKFWIVEDAGVKIGIIRKCSSDDFELNIRSVDTLGMNNDNSMTEHVSMSELTSILGENIFESKQEQKEVIEENKLGSRGWNVVLSVVDDYPSKHKAYNTDTLVIDEKQVPIYTKSKTSEVIYVAGYYGVHFPQRWQGLYGTKLETLQTYEFIGPFKTKAEMSANISLNNKRDV